MDKERKERISITSLKIINEDTDRKPGFDPKPPIKLDDTASEFIAAELINAGTRKDFDWLQDDSVEAVFTTCKLNSVKKEWLTKLRSVVVASIKRRDRLNADSKSLNLLRNAELYLPNPDSADSSEGLGIRIEGGVKDLLTALDDLPVQWLFKTALLTDLHDEFRKKYQIIHSLNVRNTGLKAIKPRKGLSSFSAVPKIHTYQLWAAGFLIDFIYSKNTQCQQSLLLAYDLVARKGKHSRVALEAMLYLWNGSIEERELFNKKFKNNLAVKKSRSKKVNKTRPSKKLSPEAKKMLSEISKERKTPQYRLIEDLITEEYKRTSPTRHDTPYTPNKRPRIQRKKRLQSE